LYTIFLLSNVSHFEVYSDVREVAIMGARESLQKLAEKKYCEINDLRMQLAQAEAYLQAIQDSIKVLPKEAVVAKAEPDLRPGTLLAQARDVLRTEGKPMHVSEILRKMGKTADKGNRISLSGSLAAYVRKKTIFRKTGPNIFALIESRQQSAETNNDGDEDLPESFGSVQ
jgi:hypothetical protein